ncbi:MAG: tetratricopeptide repeat protein [Pseudomonadota bacterium]
MLLRHFRLSAAVLLAMGLLLPFEAGSATAKKQDPLPEVQGLAGSYLAGRMASGYKDFDASATYLKRALSYDPKNIELASRAFVLLVAAGRIEESIDLAKRLKNEKDTDKLIRLVTATNDFHENNLPAAIKHLDLPKKGPVTDITGGLLGAWAMHGTGKPKAAIEVLDRLKGPDWFAIFRDYHAGLISELNGDKAEAHARFQRAYLADSKILRLAQAYAINLARDGKRDEALQVVNKYLATTPNNMMMIRLAEDIKTGVDVKQLATTPVQGAGEVMFGLGSALARNGGDELAAIYLQLALYLDETNALSLISLADLYDQLKQPDRVIDTLRLVKADSPLKASSELQLAVVLDAQEKTDEAVKHLEGILEKNPKDMEALLTMGNILRVHKRFAEAEPYYTRAVTLVEKPVQRHWPMFYFRGITYERIKQWPKAEADLKKALELQPNQPSVLNYLGYSWIDQNINLTEGMDMLKRAVGQDPKNGYVIDSVGWAYFRMGKYEDAVSWLERAIEEKPGDPVINDHLGDAYWQVGRKLEAYFQWRHAKDMKPEPEDLARIEKKLKDGLVSGSSSPEPALGMQTVPEKTQKN